jgi:hypothetical protein
MFAAPLWPKPQFILPLTLLTNNKYLVAYKIKIACKDIILLCTYFSCSTIAYDENISRKMLIEGGGSLLVTSRDEKSCGCGGAG